ncbi:MAG TPA: BamA/TamA family outer membrane protein [Planctomycetota bacterium]|nr:BamA/TamA family outer membrane protein [Planctomycetota bacterium]
MKSALACFFSIVTVLACGACTSLGKEELALPPVAFEDASTFSDGRLREIVAAEVGDAVKGEWQRSAVDDGAFALERFYASEGFAEASVAYDIVPAENGPAKAVFHVVEGPRVRLESITFDDVPWPSSELLESFFPKPSRRGDVWWVEAQLESAARDLEDYCYKNGYLDARVARPQTTFDEGRRRARVRIGLSLGIQSKLSKILLTGAPEGTEDALQRAADGFVGRPYSPLVAGALRLRMEEGLATRGFADGKATQEAVQTDEDGATTVSLALQPGPRVRIAAIEIHGAKRTLRSTVLGLLKLSPGDFYSIEQERESFRALYQSGLFATVKVGLAAGDGEERNLVVEVTEGSSTELSVEPGYGSYERFRVGLGMRLKNLFGTGRVLEVDGSLAELAQSGRVSLITPRLLGTDTRSTVSVFSNRREEPSFTTRENGAAWNLARRVTRRLSATLGYEFRSTSVSNVDVVGPAVQALVDAVEISSVSLTPVLDTRDSVFVPNDGTITKLTVQVGDGAIGSELDFVALRLAHSTYVPVWEGAVVAASWRTGMIVPTHNSDTIPLQVRFFNGGENTVRSFREDQLGPTDAQDNPLGGEVFHVLSAELRQKLTGNLDGALFFDTGNVQLAHEDYFESTGFRDAIGVGLRYVLPIGPIRLDLGINPDPQSGESRSVLHFTVGMAF